MTGFDARRIARNAGWLYFRLIAVAAADIVSVRVVLGALGVRDYGVYSAVMGVLAALFVLNSVLQLTAQRFLSCEMGKGAAGLRSQFASLLGVTLLLCLGAVLVSETAGLWFVRTRMDFQGEVVQAVRVFHIGVLLMVVKAVQIPFASILVASERMNVLAKISVAESALALGLACLMVVFGIAGPVEYVGVLLMAALVVLAVYARQCRRRFPQLGLLPCLRFGKMCEQLGFFGASSIASFANMLRYNGVNVLINLFAGTPFNATWHMAMQLGGQLYGIVGGLQQAAVPQVVKLWEHDDKRPFWTLTAGVLRWSFLLMLVCVVPLCVFTRQFLSLWIGGELPPESVAFVRCVALHFLFDALTGAPEMAILATGRVVRYQAGVSCVTGSGFFLAWAFLAVGLPPWTSVAAVAFTNLLAFGYHLWYMKRYMGLGVRSFLKRILVSRR